MKNTNITKKSFAEIAGITGRIVYKRNTYYGYTARVEEMYITYKDNTTDVIHQYSKAFTHSGCGYNKPEHAIHTTLTTLIDGVTLPAKTAGINTYSHHSMSGSDFFRTHYFEFNMENNTIEIY